MNKLLDIYNKLLSHFGPQNWWPVTSANPEFEIIIGAILTQNTAWSNVEKAIDNLRENKMLGIRAIKNAEAGKLASVIRPSGYHNQKAKKLKNMAIFLERNPIGLLKKTEIRELRERLLGINGVGPETADSIILYALKKPTFVVDAYTKRIFSRMGLIDKNADYEEVKDFFEKNLPKDTNLFNEYHALIVAHGKNICKKRPLCHACPLNSVCKKRI